MGVREIYVAVADFLLLIVITPRLWMQAVGGLFLLVAVGLWWTGRPTGRHRTPPRTPARTGVREGVRPVPVADPDTVALPVLTCADTPEDVSANPCPDVSGHDEEGVS